MRLRSLHSDPDSYPYPHPNTVPHSKRDPDIYSDVDCNTDPYLDADKLADDHQHRHPNANANGNSYAHALDNPDQRAVHRGSDHNRPVPRGNFFGHLHRWPIDLPGRSCQHKDERSVPDKNSHSAGRSQFKRAL